MENRLLAGLQCAALHPLLTSAQSTWLRAVEETKTTIQLPVVAVPENGRYLESLTKLCRLSEKDPDA
jgi:hypothetical protein